MPRTLSPRSAPGTLAVHRNHGERYALFEKTIVVVVGPLNYSRYGVLLKRFEHGQFNPEWGVNPAVFDEVEDRDASS